VNIKKIDFMDVELSVVTRSGFIDIVIRSATEKQPTFISYLNAHCSNLAYNDIEYRDILNKADIVYADGQAIVWGSRFLGSPLPERVNAGDFLIEFFQRCASSGLKVFLLGSYEEVADTIGNKLKSVVPSLDIVGTHHGFFSSDNESEVVSIINSSGADILLVGMSVPVQEKWVFKNHEKLTVPVQWCVGALFEYYAGYRHRAPKWIRRCGMEWLFRLVMEPRRLWRRYIIGNPLFVSHLVRYKLKH
jgi:N-acetylglucosaminyldiphosphoundecaprenol N-acetyl-beta-D-mannosaminyltransferase